MSPNEDLARYARQSHETPYRADIDGLRAVAVALVIAFHGFPGTVTGGFIGVDVFFVISGFLISSNIFRTLETGTFSFRDFYARRVRRIFPALLVVLAATLAYGFVVLLPSELALLGRNVAGGAGFVSNLLLWHEAGYFDQAAIYKPLLHLWSLGVEEQFYIAWPLALWLLYRRKLPPLPFLIGVGLVSFALSLFVVAHARTADFYSPLTRLWELDAGAVLAVLAMRRGIGAGGWQADLMSTGGLALILLAAFGLDRTMAFPGWLVGLPVAGALMLVAAGPKALVNRRLLANRAAVFVGMISYPLYLWHWPLISYTNVIVRGARLKDGMVAILIVVSVVLAWLTYRLVERPLRFGAARRRNTVVLVVAMAVVGGAGFGVWQAAGVPGRFHPLPSLSIPKINAAIGNGIFQPTPGMHVRKVDGITIARIGSGPDKVLFTGDSTIFQYGPRVQRLLDENRLNRTVYFVVGPSCAPVPGLVRNGLFASCNHLQHVAARVIAKQHFKTIVIGARWAGYYSPQILIRRDGKTLRMNQPAGISDFYANLEDEVRRLIGAGSDVYLVLAPVANPRFDPADMVKRSPLGFRINRAALNGVPVESLVKADTPVNDRLKEIARVTGARTLNPLHDVCGDGPRCLPFFDHGSPKFADNLHLRPSFAAGHVRIFDRLLTR